MTFFWVHRGARRLVEWNLPRLLGTREVVRCYPHRGLGNRGVVAFDSRHPHGSRGVVCFFLKHVRGSRGALFYFSKQRRGNRAPLCDDSNRCRGNRRVVRCCRRHGRGNRRPKPDRGSAYGRCSIRPRPAAYRSIPPRCGSRYCAPCGPPDRGRWAIRRSPFRCREYRRATDGNIRGGDTT